MDDAHLKIYKTDYVIGISEERVRSVRFKWKNMYWETLSKWGLTFVKYGTKTNRKHFIAKFGHFKKNPSNV